MTKVLLVKGEDDFGAMLFEQNFDVEEVYTQIIESDENKITLVCEDQNIFVSLHEFEDIDPDFIEFVRNLQDYDIAKNENFYIVGE